MNIKAIYGGKPKLITYINDGSKKTDMVLLYNTGVRKMQGFF